MDINIDESITKWEKDVIDTSKNNRLLYFNSDSFLKITTPSMLFLFDDLVNKDKKMGVHLTGDEENRRKDEIIFSRKDGLGKALSSMYYQANSALKEHGSNVLFISFGLLKWKDENAKTVETQLFFVPVTLSRKMYDDFTLESTEGDIFFNPVLREKLEQFGIKFDFTFEDNLNLSEAMRNFKLTVKDTKWSVSRNSYLGVVSFTNNNIYNDIKKNHDAIKKNDLTRALAGDFEVIKKLNEKMPRTIDYSIDTVMDADSSQISAVYAARAGASFILNGPPGTGKSQTISNIIADSMKNNRSVLFVSEKNAAIEVVKKRLQESGLGDFILSFHGNASKSEIIKSLYKSVENNQHVSRTLVPTDRYSGTLNDYVHAVHEKRGNLGRSVYNACMVELENSCQFSLKIGAGMIDITPEVLENIEFQISEFNDYLDIIENFDKMPVDLQLPRYRENPEKYYRGIDSIENGIDGMEEIRDQIKNCTGVDVASMKDAEKVYRLGSVLNPEITLEKEFLDAEFIQDAYELLESREKLIQEYRYMSDIFMKKRKKEFLNLDLDALKKNLVENYSSGLKRLSSDYKKIVKDVMDLTEDGSRKHYNEIIEDIDYAMKIREKEAALEAVEESMKSRNIDSEDVYDKIRYAKKIISNMPGETSVGAVTEMVSGMENMDSIMEFKSLYESVIDGINSLSEVLPSAGSMADKKLEEIREQIVGLSSLDVERYAKFMELYDSLKSSGIDISPAFNMDLHTDSILQSFRHSFNHEFVSYYVRNDDNLKNFRASSHERLAGMFIDYDRKRIEINRINLVSELTDRRREMLAKYPGASMIIKTENAKKRFQKPLKTLFGELREVLPALKPCIMMSPNNVSAFLDSDFSFDLIIFDEASQLTPPDAVGSLIRSKQAIISGDTQQLPPTSFFENVNISKYEDDYVVLDNILDQFDAIGLAKIPLKWHYRSVDDRLIAFSNRYFYENSLETFPSAYVNSPDTGLEFFKIEGTYSRGKSRTNRAEANEVVRIIKEELLQTNSIGVVTLSEAQRSAIEETLSSYSRHDSVLAELINNDGIFVKNLENVQGDEKDVIILSTGYGKDDSGRLTMNFGPINSTGGEKRLNVAITRARKKFIVVSSMDPEDIRVPETAGRGPELLKQYLIYAKNHGSGSIIQKFRNDDAIINDVAAKLEAEGFTTVKNVGYSMNNIALAVIDPDDDNHYILGIETDGRIYNSMKTASERERIRKAILSARGWNLYRIWSVDYMKNPEKVLHEIINNINRYKTEVKSAGREI